MSPAQVLAWRPSRLGETVGDLEVRRRAMLSLQDEIDGGRPPPAWIGSDAVAARRSHRLIREALNDLVAQVSMVIGAVGVAEEAVRSAQRLLRSAWSYAATEGYVVNKATGTVTDRGVDGTAHARADRMRIRTEIQDWVDHGMAAAEHADRELAATLRRVVSGDVDGGSAELADAALTGSRRGDRALLGPPQRGSPSGHYAWWTTLTAAEQAKVVRDHPSWIGNADGIPAHARHQANVGLIERYRSELEDLRDKAPPLPPSGDLNRLLAWRATYGHLQDKLDALAAIERLLSDHRGRRLLALDVTGTRELRAAVSTDDIDAADHVAVLVPGLGAAVRRNLEGHDDDLNDLVRQAESLGAANGDRGRCAGVVWFGYDVPQADETLFGPRSVLTDEPAREGADDLARFLVGIDASRPDDPHLTVIGHSYGTLAAGLALRHSTGVDDAVFLGSPGLGADRLADLDVPHAHAFNLEADWDVVADLGRFGGDPSDLRGIRQLSTDGQAPVDVDGDGRPDTRRLSRVTGHVHYFTDGSTSQHNMAAVVSGNHDDVVRRDREGWWP